MKNIIFFVSSFLGIFILSCTVTNYRKDPPAEAAGVVVVKEKTPSKPVTIINPSKDPGTVIKTNSVEIREVAVLDTAALSAWLARVEDRLVSSNESDYQRFSVLLEEYRQTMRQNNELLLKWAAAESEKEVAKETVSVAQKVMIDVPTIMYSIFALCVLIIAIRQQYLKVKLEDQIKNIRSCRIENQK